MSAASLPAASTPYGTSVRCRRSRMATVRRQPSRRHRPNGMNRGSCDGTACSVDDGCRRSRYPRWSRVGTGSRVTPQVRQPQLALDPAATGAERRPASPGMPEWTSAATTGCPSTGRTRPNRPTASPAREEGRSSTSSQVATTTRRHCTRPARTSLRPRGSAPRGRLHVRLTDLARSVLHRQSARHTSCRWAVAPCAQAETEAAVVPAVEVRRL